MSRMKVVRVEFWYRMLLGRAEDDMRLDIVCFAGSGVR